MSILNTNNSTLEVSVFIDFKTHYGVHRHTIQAIYTDQLYEWLDQMCESTYGNYNKTLLRSRDFTLFFKEKPLSRRSNLLIDYNIHNYNVVTIQEYCLYGGSDTIMQHCSSLKDKIINFCSPSDINWTLDLIESMILLLQDLHVSIRSPYPKISISCAVARFIKMRSHKSLLMRLQEIHFMNYLDGLDYSFPQSLDTYLTDFKSLLENFKDIRDSKIMQCIKKIINFAVAFSFFDKLGIPLDKFGFSIFDRELMNHKFTKNKSDFVYTLLSSIHYLTEKGYQYFKTGNYSHIFHSGVEYSQIFDKILDIRNKSKVLTNCEAFGFTESSYRAILDETIEEISCIIKFNDSLTKVEYMRLKEYANELKLYKFNLTTIKASREHRDPPFSVLLFGDSGIGKTTLKDILFFHFGKLFNLDCDKSFCYTRNPVAKYWDGFSTSSWCVILDDIAFKHPNLGEDESCMEFLQINNSTPFVPDQAALEDKGRTPMRCKLVIGTTNSKNLNAHFYFACASAAQRRFPFIITPTVKTEYADSNGMLDSTKCDQEENVYPDYWNFRVEKVVNLKAIAENMGRPAQFEDIAHFDNINKFLQWYSEAALKHDRNCKIISTSIDMIANIELCDTCHLAKTVCICTKDQSFVSQILNFATFSLSSWCLHNFYNILAATTLYKFPIIRNFISTKMRERLYLIATRHLFYKLGDKFQDQLGNKNKLLKLAKIIIGLYASYKSYTWLMNRFYTITDLDVQTSIIEGKPPVAQENERENVWYNEDFELTSFNLTPTITSSKSLSKQQIINKIGKNCHIMIIKNKKLNYTKKFRVLNLNGNAFLMNNHSHTQFHSDDEVHLISQKNYGLSRNISFKFSEDYVKRDFINDIAVLNILHVNPGPNIFELIPLCSNIIKQNGFYIQRLESGTLEIREVKNSQTVNYEGNNFRVRAYKVYIEKPTVFGDCGMPLILETPMGYMIGGIHVSGIENIAISTTLTQDMIKPLLPEIIFQQGNPQLSAPSQVQTLGELHHKSVFRYIESGTLEVIGSLQGFRSHPRSSVERTPIHEDLKVYGYTEKYTKPMMSGYTPFRTAALDLVKPVTYFDLNILEKCKKSLLRDILEQLKIKDIKNYLHPYDLHTAINGAPSISYVDRLKSKTSAGNPWKCKKDKFLIPIEGTHDYVLTPEIEERVNKICALYLENIRYHPIFCAHLKDEAVTFAKSIIGKTRVFTGSPMDWSIVVRMLYLSMLRFIKNNKLAFEMAVSTVAQSMEWSKLLQYLLFEDDKSIENFESHPLSARIIAGDYKAFDKRTSPVFTLAGYWIQIELAKLSGNYSTDEIKMMWGVAYDTAYPTVDFNGDIIQLYGSNPSGHPETVEINGFDNSLYMRYAYCVLHPEGKVNDFKDNVRLLTYGDDNIMVSKVDWFNHTAISSILSTIGVTYTMADKEAKSVPFIHISQASFLKRSWKWNYEMKCYLAPLEHDSIEKMLMTWTRSKIASENQMMDIIESAVSEYFFYGRNIFNKKTKILKEIVHNKGWDYLIEESTFPTWQQLKTRFKTGSHKLGLSVHDEFDSDYSDDEDYVTIAS